MKNVYNHYLFVIHQLKLLLINSFKPATNKKTIFTQKNMKTIFSLIALAFIFGVNAQNVIIPDANFKGILVNNSAINTNGDTEIQVTEANAYTGLVDISNNNSITDITGIEEFTSMFHFNAWNCTNIASFPTFSSTSLSMITMNNSGQITSMDVSGFPNLTTLRCGNFNLSTLDVTSNPLLQNLQCMNNSLSTLDLSNNPQITILNVSDNPLGNIDVSNLLSLGSLNAANIQATNFNLINNSSIYSLQINDNNNLNTLDISNLTNLGNLNAGGTGISNLTFSSPAPPMQTLLVSNTNLTSLATNLLPTLTFIDISGCSISTIDLSNNANLSDINFVNSALTAIDLSAQTNLYELNGSNNANLANVNLASGNNANLYYCDLQNNPALTCIQVDDPAASASYAYWQKDAAATYSTNCGTAPCTVNFTSLPLKNRFLDHGVGITNPGVGLIDTNSDGEIQCSEATSYTGAIFLNGFNAGDLNGLEAFTGVTKIYIGNVFANNNIPSPDFSFHPNLVDLEVNGPDFTTMNLTSNVALSNLKIMNNTVLDTLDLTANINLDTLWVRFNTFPGAVDLSNNQSLVSLNLGGNGLTALTGLENLIQLETCILNSNPQISSVDVSNSNSLKILWASETDITSIDVSQNPNLISLNISETAISAIDLSQNPLLELLNISETTVASIDVTNQPNLKSISMNNTNITQLDFSQNLQLEEINFVNGLIENLDFSGLPSLSAVSLGSSNTLEKVSVANGNNTDLYFLDVSSCPNLTCVEVDDIAFAQSQTAAFFWLIDDASIYSLDCNLGLGISSSSEKVITVFPNPAADQLIIQAPGLQEVVIYNILGHEVMRHTSNEIEISNLISGLYYLEIKSLSGHYSRKVVKM